MDILLVTSAHPPFDPRIYHKMLRSLQRHGFAARILLPNQVELSNRCSEFVSFRGFRGKWGRVGNDAVIFERCARLRPNWIFFFDPELLPLMLIYKLIFRGKVLYDNHEDYPSYIMVKESIPLWTRVLARFVYNFLYWMARRVFEFIVYSDHFTVPPDGLKSNEVVIYNYPVLANYPPTRKVFDLIFPGSLDLGVCRRLLNIAEALEARRLRKIRFLIVGRDMSPADRALIERCCGQMRYVELILEQDLQHEAVQVLISQSRIGLIPLPDIEKFRRNIPTKLFEYLLHAIPVIASDLPPISNFLGQTSGNYVVGEDGYEQTYCARILEILDDYPEASREARANVGVLVRKWNWSRTEEPKLISIVGGTCEP